MSTDDITKQSYYRLPLPGTCISFTSVLGKKVFAESLGTGHMECYFKQAAQLCTQHYPEYCGLTTLVLVLNALQIDPGTVWKMPFRWYHENTLKCCISLDTIQEIGITFDEFVSIARLNSVNASATRICSTVTLETLRNVVLEYNKRDDAFLVVSFARAVLMQQGDGHFSPIAGYHPGRDLVLILDVARFIYPPYWVPLSLVYESMKALDPTTGKPRRFVEMSRRDEHPHVLFKLATGLCLNTESRKLQTMTLLVQRWETWRLNHQEEWMTNQTIETSILDEGCEEFVQALLRLDGDVTLLTTKSHDTCPTNAEQYKHSFMLSLIIQIEKLPHFNKVKSLLTNVTSIERNRLKTLFPVSHNNRCKHNCAIYNRLDSEHFVSFLFISWPEPSTDSKITLNRGMFAYLSNDIFETEIRIVMKELNFVVEFLKKEYARSTRVPEYRVHD